MSIDATTLPVSGAALLAVAAYVAFISLAAAPAINERELMRDGWIAKCEAGLAARVEATRKPAQNTPQIPDLCAMLTAGDREMQALCRFIPDTSALAAEAERRRRAEERARIDRALEGVGDACTCATVVYRNEHWIDLAIYAGSARVVVPTEVKNRDAALARALRSPQCRMEG